MKNYTLLYILAPFMSVLFLTSCNEDPYVPVEYGDIEGEILRDWNEQPIANAKISTSPATQIIYTDSLGKFKLEGIAVTDYNITASKEGFAPWTEKVAVTGSLNVPIKLYLSAEGEIELANEVVEMLMPYDKQMELPLEIEFSWSQKQENYRGRTIYYDLYTIDTETLDEKMHIENTTDTLVVASGFRFNSSYLWYLIVKAEDEVLGESDMLRFETQFVPDNLLMYASSVENNYEIMAYDSVAGSYYQITDHPAKDWFPRKAPYGELVGFISNRDNSNHIYTMMPDGTDIKKISQLPVTGYNNNGTGFAWSPDAGYIIYPHNDKLIKINKEGYDSQVLATAPAGRHFGECDWSRFGDKIVVQTVGENIYESEIYIMNSDGSEMTQLVEDLPGRIESPSISLDGSEVFFTSDIEGLDAWDGTQLDARIFSVDTSTKEYSEVAVEKPDGYNVWFPRVLRDGNGLTFSIGAGSSTARTIYYALFTDSSSSGISTVEVTDGDMPDW